MKSEMLVFLLVTLLLESVLARASLTEADVEKMIESKMLTARLQFLDDMIRLLTNQRHEIQKQLEGSRVPQTVGFPFEDGVHRCGRLKHVKFNEYLIPAAGKVITTKLVRPHAAGHRSYDWIFQHRSRDSINATVLTYDGKELLTMSDVSTENDRHEVITKPYRADASFKTGSWGVAVDAKAGPTFIFNYSGGEFLVVSDSLNREGSRNVYAKVEFDPKQRNLTVANQKWSVELVDCQRS